MIILTLLMLYPLHTLSPSRELRWLDWSWTIFDNSELNWVSRSLSKTIHKEFKRFEKLAGVSNGSVQFDLKQLMTVLVWYQSEVNKIFLERFRPSEIFETDWKPSSMVWCSDNFVIISWSKKLKTNSVKLKHLWLQIERFLISRRSSLYYVCRFRR